MDRNTVLLIVIVAAAFLVVWMGRVYYYRTRLNRLRELFDRYNQFVAAYVAEDDPAYQTHHDWLEGRTAEVQRYWRQAGVEDSTFTDLQFHPGSLYGTAKYSAQKNWLTLNQDVPLYIRTAFLRAIGVFEDRARDAKNPLFALAAILTAPQAIISWLGFRGDTTFAKFLSLIWSAILVVATLMQLFGFSLRDLGVQVFPAAPEPTIAAPSPPPPTTQPETPAATETAQPSSSR